MSLAVLADHMASKGRGPDSMLIHMSPSELQGLQALAMSHGGSLTINPETGLPEAGFLDKLLPAIIGFALNAVAPGAGEAVAGLWGGAGGAAAGTAALVGGAQAVRTGSLAEGVQAGLGAYGGANLASGMANAGASQLAGEALLPAAAEQAALEGITLPSNYADVAARSVTPAQIAAAKEAALASGSNFDIVSKGFDAASKNPMQFAKDNWKSLAGVAVPAILAGENVKSNLPPTVTKPGMIRPYSYDPYSGGFVASNPYEVAPKRAAEGGIMGFDESSNSPMARYNLEDMGNTGGMFNYAHDGGGVMRMAEGGLSSIIKMAGGTPPEMLTDEQLFQKTGSWEAAAAARDAQNNALNQYNWSQQAAAQQPVGSAASQYAAANNIDLNQNINNWIASNPNANRAAIDTEMNKYGISQADVNRALSASTVTSPAVDYALSHGMGLSDINQNIANFTNAAATKNATDAQIDAAMKQYGLSNEDVARALAATGGSKGEQYALLAGNMGLAGLNQNINSWLAANPKATLADAQAAMKSVDINEADVKRATGKSLAELFTKKPPVCGPGFELNAAGDACVPITKKPPVCGPGFELNAAGDACVPITEKTKALTCGPGYHLNADGTACIPNATTIVDHFCPSGYHWDPVANACVLNTSATQNTTDIVTTPTSLVTAPATTLPVGVSGSTGPSIFGGGATVNPNGTITSSPVIPGIPVGGFTGMESLRNAYTKGGGSLGYVPYAPKTMAEFDAKYNKLTGGSKQAYDYLMGKTPYSPTPWTPTGEVQKPYAESVLGMPANTSKKMYMFDPATKQYKINPDYAIPTYDSKGNKTYNVTNRDVSTYLASKPSNADFYNWAKTNNLSIEQIAAATGMPITEVQKMFSGGAPADTAAATTTTGGGSGGSTTDTSYNIFAEGGLAALTMAGGGVSHLGDYSDGGRLLRGPGDGVSDSIPATIGDKRPARLADGEFVVPARIVSELGNGSTEAGARKLYAMMDRVQAARRGSIGRGNVAKNSRADKYLPA